MCLKVMKNAKNSILFSGPIYLGMVVYSFHGLILGI